VSGGHRWSRGAKKFQGGMRMRHAPPCLLLIAPRILSHCCIFKHHFNLRISYCKLFSLNYQCFQLLMRVGLIVLYSTFAIRDALLYLFFKSWNCWLFRVISLSKYIQFDLNKRNNRWITYDRNLAYNYFMSYNFMTHENEWHRTRISIDKK